MVWLAEAARLGKVALSAGLLLWFRCGCSRSGESLTVSERLQQEFGLSRWSFAAGIRKLESAGLITVERNPGRKLRITLSADAK